MVTMSLLMYCLFMLVVLVTNMSTSDIQQPSFIVDSGNTLSWQRTLIAVELRTDMSDHVFLLGGFTNGSLSRCSSDVAVDPCAIPIRHRLSSNDDSDAVGYTDWADGDHFLDFHGPEDGQGTSNGIQSAGTPTWKLNSSAALGLLNSRDVSANRLNSTFWLIDLDMDCSSSGGYFEIQINLKTSVSKMYSSRRGSRKPEMVWESNGAPTPSRTSSKTRIPKKRQQAKNGGRKIPRIKNGDRKRRQTNAEERLPRTDPRFSLANPRPRSNTHTPGKPMGMASISNRGKSDFVQGVRHRTIKLRGPRNPSCIEDFPYITSRFVGKCGYANIFKHDSGDCEINEL